MFGPALLGNVHLVWLDLAVDDLAVNCRDHALGFVRADVNAEEITFAHPSISDVLADPLETVPVEDDAHGR